MLTIKAINNNKNSVRVYNHATKYSKSDLLAYANNVNSALFADIRLKNGYSILTHKIDKNGAKIKHNAPDEKRHKIFVDRCIDYSGVGYDINISDNEHFNDIIVINCDQYCTHTINSGRYAALYDNIVKYVSDYDALYYALEDVKNNVRDREYETMHAAIRDYLGVNVTAKQAGDVRAIVNKATSAHYLNCYNEYDRAAELLTVLTPHKWECRTIRGYCQGDAATVIFPVDIYGDNDIDYLESFYFGNYYDYSITYCNETISDFIPDPIAWNENELNARILELTRDCLTSNDNISAADIVYNFDV